MNYEGDARVDPKLKELRDKIIFLLKEYEAGGAISLHSKDHGEFYLEIPKWSLFKFETLESGEVSLRLQFKKDKDHHDDLEATVGMVLSMKDVFGRFFMTLDNVEKELRKKMEIEHDPHWKYKE